MGAPQIIYTVILAINLLTSAGKCDKEGGGQFFGSVVGTIICVALLMWGGFY